jgi:hypothetical protein
MATDLKEKGWEKVQIKVRTSLVDFTLEREDYRENSSLVVSAFNFTSFFIRFLFYGQRRSTTTRVFFLSIVTFRIVDEV